MHYRLRLKSKEATRVFCKVFLLLLSPLKASAEPVDFDVIEKHSGADFAKGYMYQEQGKYELALDAYSKSIKAHPENMETYLHHANVLLELKRYREVLSDMDKYSSLMQQTSDKDDKSRVAIVELKRAKALDGLGQSAEALKEYKKSLENDDTLYVHEALGRYYKRHGQRDLAVKELQSVKTRMHSGGWSYNWGKFETEIDDMLKELNASATTQQLKQSNKRTNANQQPAVKRSK